MYDQLGDALMNGVKGWRMADQDMAAKQERDYQAQKRQQDDQWTRQQRERMGVQWGREDEAYNQQQVETRRQKAIRDGLTAYSRGKMTGDYSGLREFMKSHDEAHGPNVVDVKGDANGNVTVLMDDQSAHNLTADQFVQSMRVQLSPENWLKLEGEKEMVGVRTGAQKELQTHQGGITRENQTHQGGVQMDVADNASGNRMVEQRHQAQFQNPSVVTTYDQDGVAIQDVYKAGKKMETVKGLDPQAMKAIASSKKGSGKGPDQLDVDKFFAQLSAKQFGVPDANGNLMLDEVNGAMKSKVEALSSLSYRELGDKFTPLQHFARALKFVRENPAMTEKDAMKELQKQGKSAPGFWADKAEREQYMREVKDILERSNAVPMSASQRGVQTSPANGINPQTTGQGAAANIITPSVPAAVLQQLPVNTPFRIKQGEHAGRLAKKLESGELILIE